MGQNMCNDVDAHDLLKDPSSVANMYDFQPSTWPEDRSLKKLLQSSSIAPGDLKDKPYKHRVFDRYYWGGWANEKPSGKGIYYICDPGKNLYYQGQVVGQPNGIGKLVFNNGDWVYEGRVKDGQAHGNGIIKNKKQGYDFQGQWINSRPTKGKLILHQLTKQQTQKTNSNNGDIFIDYDEKAHDSTIKYPDGRVYVGQIDRKRFVPHGIGKVTYPDGSQYIGQWQSGQIHGVGKFQWNDGSCYNGDYMFGKRHGMGKFVFNNGRYYNGKWSQGKQNGQGTLFSKQGQIIKQGLWKKGVLGDQIK